MARRNKYPTVTPYEAALDAADNATVGFDIAAAQLKGAIAVLADARDAELADAEAARKRAEVAQQEVDRLDRVVSRINDFLA